MKRRQFLKMIPVGIVAAFVPGLLKSEPDFMLPDARGMIVKVPFNVEISGLDKFAEMNSINRIHGETDTELRERLIYKLTDISYV